MEYKKAVSRLREILVSHGRESLLPRIGKAFEKIAERESKKTDVQLSIAHEKDERSARVAVKDVLAKLKIKTDDLKTRVDPTLVGGWRLEGNGTLVDASYKKALVEMYNRAIN